MDFPSRPKGLEQDSHLLFPGGWAKSEYQSGPIQSSELSIGAGDRWHYRRSAAKAGAGRVDRKRSARSRPTYDRSNRLATFSGTRPVQPRPSLAPSVPSALSASKSQNAENRSEERRVGKEC